jgi:hypothetical protein
VLEKMDADDFEKINYFQNEFFKIRSVIKHDFNISGVTLNFIDENGNQLFDRGLERTGGALTSPEWYIDHEKLISANPVYKSGRHYLKVAVTARAEAGHSGRNEDITNTLYNLCWYPESDIARIQINVVTPTQAGKYRFNREAQIPVNIFDDDNLGEAYMAMITAGQWINFNPGYTEQEKLEQLTLNRASFLDTQLLLNQLASPMKSASITKKAPPDRGDYRLIVLVKDKKDDPSAEVWGKKVFNIEVIEEGIPSITIESPDANTSPKLSDGNNFTLNGYIQNIDELEKVKIAWVPFGASSAADMNSKAEAALLSGNTGTLSGGIKVWELDLSPPTNVDFAGKLYLRQTFSKTFDIFTDFMYNGSLENETKFFMVYARGKDGGDVFEFIRFMSYQKPPVLKIISPLNWQTFSPGDIIPFEIESYSGYGVFIDSLTLVSVNDGDKTIDLTRNGDKWTAETSQHNKTFDGYKYTVTSKDRLGIEVSQDVNIMISSPPILQHITSDHNAGSVFSGRDTVTIQAVFDSVVNTVTGTPRLRLEGFTPSSVVRYANYARGAGSTTLEFDYKPDSGDYTGAPGSQNGLAVTRLELNGGTIVSDPNYNLSGANTLPSRKRLNIDAIAPVITGIKLDGRYGDNDYPGWFREGASVEAEVTVNKDIMVLGVPSLLLQFNSGASRQAGFVRMIGSNIMVFEYKIRALDEALPVRIASSCFSAGDLNMITDTAGSNGNFLSLTGVPAPTGAVDVDAVPPAALNVSYTANGNTPTSKTIQIATGNIEPSAQVEYTKNGQDWLPIVSPYRITISDPGTFNVFARQIDRAGNISPTGTGLEFEMGGSSDLIGLLCDNPNGAYPAGSTMTFKLLFSGRVKNTANSTFITIQGGGVSNTGAAVSIYFPAEAAGDVVLTANWTVVSGKTWEPVRVTAINLGGVTGESQPTVGGIVTAVMADFNNTRTGLRVLSIPPDITQVNGQATTNNQTKASNNNEITLKFSQKVWPESGKITVRPAANWNIPPVLSNVDYSKVSRAISGNNLTTLNANYKATTHGLLKTGAQFNGTPDTDTKYVLNFDQGLNNAALRPVFEAAKYLWQEIETTSGSQVTGAGTDTITVKLDTLPNGREWKIEIDPGAFRDEAGNQFAGVLPANADYRFWSEKTADPVIRVNRTSNNNPTTAPSDAAVNRTRVQYRIDCETPGAVISYNTWNRGAPPNNTTVPNIRGVNFGVANITSSAPFTTPAASSVFRAYPQKGDYRHNSNILDASVTELGNMMTAAGAVGSGNSNAPTAVQTYSTEQWIGDTSIYTARKDYIAAIAIRNTAPALNRSDRSYEGAFKTVLVFRNPTNRYQTPVFNNTTGHVNGINFPDNNWYIKIEGSNVQNGAVTISGFPLDNNNISGEKSKYMYQSATAAGSNNVDRVWISWEIVSDFWHVFMVVTNTNGTLHTGGIQPGGRNSWDYWPELWYKWMYRKYGNWGLLDGHMSAYNQDYEQWNGLSGYPAPTAP